jgi:hypothetical protein
MDLNADATLSFPREVVFAAYRDDLLKLLPYLPNVRGIDVVSRDDTGAITKLVNVWHGGGDLPSAARAFLSESMLSWTDRATWNRDAFACEWAIETHAFTEAVRCRGTTHFLEQGRDATRLEIRGTLAIDAKKIRGVPALLAGKVGRVVEEFLVAKIRPNLVEVSAGLGRYLASRAPAG